MPSSDCVAAGPDARSGVDDTEFMVALITMVAVLLIPVVCIPLLLWRRTRHPLRGRCGCASACESARSNS